MPNSAAAKESDSAVGAPEAGVLLFLLEGAGSQTRQAIYDAAKASLGAQDIKLTPVLFSSHGFAPSAALIASGLAGAVSRKVNTDKLADAIQAAMDAHLAKSAKLPDGLGKLIDAARKRGMPVAAVTSVPEEAALAALAHLGFQEGAIRLFSHPDTSKGFPRADMWVKAAKAYGKSTRACLVVADDAACCKSALAAGMKCVAIPTALSAHQDFCGADLIMDAWDEVSAREILETVIPIK